MDNAIKITFEELPDYTAAVAILESSGFLLRKDISALQISMSWTTPVRFSESVSNLLTDAEISFKQIDLLTINPLQR